MRSLLFLAVVLAGCAGSRPVPARPEAAAQPVAFALSSVDARQPRFLLRSRSDPEAAASFRRAAALWSEGAAHFGVGFSDARTAVEADTALSARLLDVQRWAKDARRGATVPADLQSALQAASATAGATRVLLVSGTSRDESISPAVLVGAALGGAIGSGIIGAAAQPATVTVNADLFDVPTGTLVGRVRVTSQVDADDERDVEAVTRAVVFSLFTGGTPNVTAFRPRTFRNRDVRLYEHDGSSREVRTRGLDGYALVLADSSRVPLTTLRSIVTEPAGRGDLLRLR